MATLPYAAGRLDPVALPRLRTGLRAEALKAENGKRLAEGKAPRMPEENYYGWLVNDRLEELKALFR